MDPCRSNIGGGVRTPAALRVDAFAADDCYLKWFLFTGKYV